jgi:hypothetical protein
LTGGTLDHGAKAQPPRREATSIKVKYRNQGNMPLNTAAERRFRRF